MLRGGGEAEVVLADGSRCDCVTGGHAIEFDFGAKWAEAIGQALHYGALTGLRPGVVLILETPADLRGLDRLRRTIHAYGLPIATWTITVHPAGLNSQQAPITTGERHFKQEDGENGG